MDIEKQMQEEINRQREIHNRVLVLTRWWIITLFTCPCRCRRLLAWVYSS